MIRIKSALKALRNRWVFSIFLLIQFTIGLSTITGSVNVFYNLFYLNNHSVLDLASTYLVTPDLNTDRLREGNFSKEQVEEVYKQIKNNGDVIAYGTYYEDFVPVNASTRPLNSKMLSELTKTTFNRVNPEISAIVIDENYSKLLNLQLDQGKWFTDQDLKKDSNEKLNILVGS